MMTLAITSGFHSMYLPDGLSQSILIFRHDPSSDSFGVCVGQVHAAGLRGAILGWTDGLLDLLKRLYYGPLS
jgi:hypothetical protein